jgi:hypothetical protein
MKKFLVAMALLAVSTTSWAEQPGMGGGSHPTGPSVGITHTQAAAPTKKQKGLQAQGLTDLANYYHYVALGYAQLAAYYQTLGNSSLVTSFLTTANTFQDAYISTQRAAEQASANGQ